MQLTNEELDLCRQWFDSVQDRNPAYLTGDDYTLAIKLYEKLGIRVPNSIRDAIVRLPRRKPVAYIEIPSSELAKIGGKK